MKAWICDHNGRWGRSEDTVWETGTLRMLVRKWNAEREQDDITHTQMSKKGKASCSYQCDTTNEVASCSSCSHIWCGHLCCSRLLRASGHKTRWNPHRSADALRGTGVEISHSETSSGLWSFFVLRCLSETSLFDKRVRRWGKNGKNQSVRLWPAVGWKHVCKAAHLNHSS